MVCRASFARRESAGAATPARGGSSTTRSGVSVHRARKASTSVCRKAGEDCAALLQVGGQVARRRLVGLDADDAFEAMRQRQR